MNNLYKRMIVRKVKLTENKIEVSGSDVSENEKQNIILEEISKFYGIHTSAIASVSRKKELIKCRHVFFYLMKFYTSYSYNRISGSLVSWHKFNHASIIYAIKKIQGEMDVYPVFRQDIEKLKKRIDERI